MRKDLAVCCTIGCFFPLLMSCAANPTGFTAGPLRPCPDTPNCVSSMDKREKHAVDPFAYDGDWTAERDRLVKMLLEMKRTEVVAVEERYVRAECRSLIFRFVDDLEFYFDTDEQVVHLRSAARVGHSDFGVNRKRVEEMRRLWVKEQ